jgi:hypothetical protein
VTEKDKILLDIKSKIILLKNECFPESSIRLLFNVSEKHKNAESIKTEITEIK